MMLFSGSHSEHFKILCRSCCISMPSMYVCTNEHTDAHSARLGVHKSKYQALPHTFAKMCAVCTYMWWTHAQRDKVPSRAVGNAAGETAVEREGGGTMKNGPSCRV